MGIELLAEEQYRELQKLGNFDAKTSSWVKTPSGIRKLGGASFVIAARHCLRVSHGAESYYAPGRSWLAKGLSFGWVRERKLERDSRVGALPLAFQGAPFALRMIYGGAGFALSCSGSFPQSVRINRNISITLLTTLRFCAILFRF